MLWIDSNSSVTEKGVTSYSASSSPPRASSIVSLTMDERPSAAL